MMYIDVWLLNGVKIQEPHAPRTVELRSGTRWQGFHKFVARMLDFGICLLNDYYRDDTSGNRTQWQTDGSVCLLWPSPSQWSGVREMRVGNLFRRIVDAMCTMGGGDRNLLCLRFTETKFWLREPNNSSAQLARNCSIIEALKRSFEPHNSVETGNWTG